MGARQMSMQSRNTDSAWLVLDALDVHVAVLDQNGLILHTNRTWDEFAVRNPREDGTLPPHVGVGTNYLEICQTAVGSSAENAISAYRGISDVLAGRKRQFTLEYPCHSPLEQRWFVMKVTPLKGMRPRQAVVVHTNVTALKQAEFETHRKTQELANALENLENFAGQMKTTLRLGQSMLNIMQHAHPYLSAAAQGDGAAEKGRLKLLSTRELEVLTSLARGERVGDIATRLSLSVKSVSTYRSRVLEKLQVRTTSDLITFMARIGAM